MVNTYKNPRHKRQTRVRGKLKAVGSRPRLSVFRSNQHIYAQIIDDKKGTTLVSASDTNTTKGTKLDRAIAVGQTLAELATKAKVTKVFFDRSHYKFHGRVKALAESARKHGLEF